MQPRLNSDEVDLARRLKETRESLGLSQVHVACRLGIARTAISMIESGHRRVEAVMLQRLSKLYERPIGYFTGDDSSISGISSDALAVAQAFSRLSAKDRHIVVSFIEYLLSRSRRKPRGGAELSNHGLQMNAD